MEITTSEVSLFNADCREIVSLVLPENSVDTIITDPPYGLEFMGKGWDKGVPGVDFWKAFLAVTKPGGMLLAFGGTRTFHRMTVAIEDAGWEIRDCMMWLYGSGFPKSHNLHGTFEGWGTALKPAWEPIIVAMKPIDGTFAENAEKWGVAGINVDGGRIGLNQYDREEYIPNRVGYKDPENYINPAGKGVVTDFASPEHKTMAMMTKGRWPANLILDAEAGAMLDEQSGELGNNARKSKANGRSSLFGSGVSAPTESVSDTGGASRFFYCAKASKSERNAGCEAMDTKPFVQFQTGNGASGKASSLSEGRDTKHQNNHPTVKPLKLMEYLCTLTKTPTGGVVLDPFMGSGTTGLACKNTGRSFIGIEQSPEYFKIAEARINGK